MQMALYWVVLGLALGRIRAESLPDHMEALPGLIRVEEGTLYAIQEYVQIKYSLEPLERFKVDLEKELTNIEELGAVIKEDPTLSAEHKALLTNATRNIVSFTKWHPAYNIRKRRGLVNLIGNIQHELFGVVDERTLNKRMGELDSRMSKITRSYTASAAAVNTIQHNMCQLKEAVTQLSRRMNQGNAEDGLQHFTQLAFFISSVRARIQNLRYQRKHVLQAMMAAAQGTVEPTLITPLDIQDILHKFQHETMIQPLFTPELSPVFYGTLTSYLTPSGLSILVPLKTAAKFTVHKLYPFPTKTTGIVKLATIRAQETILANASGALITPQEPLNRLCKQPSKRVFVCMKPVWNININTPSCERAILFNPELMSEVCTYNGLNVSATPYFVPLEEITAIYFSTPTRVTTTCAQRTPPHTVQGTYILPNTCSLTSKHLTLPASKSFESAFRARSSLWYPYEFNFANTEVTNTPFNISWESMKQLDIIPKVFHDTNIDYVYPVGVSLLLVTLCALIAGVLMWRQRMDNSSTFDDIILALKTGNHEALEQVGRVHCRQQKQRRNLQQERTEDAPHQDDVHQV